MSEKKESFKVTLEPMTAAVGFLKKFKEPTSKDVVSLAQLFKWFEQQGENKGKAEAHDPSDHRAVMG